MQEQEPLTSLVEVEALSSMGQCETGLEWTVGLHTKDIIMHVCTHFLTCFLPAQWCDFISVYKTAPSSLSKLSKALLFIAEFTPGIWLGVYLNKATPCV